MHIQSREGAVCRAAPKLCSRAIPEDASRANLEEIVDQHCLTGSNLSGKQNWESNPVPTENSAGINPHPCGTLVADLVDALFLLASTAESKGWQSLPRPPDHLYPKLRRLARFPGTT
jgi:hypothetical protein